MQLRSEQSLVALLAVLQPGLLGRHWAGQI
jgi:hypothetical protein